VPELPAVLRAVASVPVYRPFADELLAAPLRAGRRVVNAEEVGDHHAILPTSREPSPGQLSPDEKRLYDLVARRFMAVLSLPAEFELTEIIVAIDPSEPLPDELQAPLRFRARGRVCITAGWRLVDPPASNARDSQLPDVQAGGEALAHEVNRRLVGLSLDDLRAIPNVILAAGGAHKVPVIHAALRAGFVDTLVTDEATAQAVLASAG